MSASTVGVVLKQVIAALMQDTPGVYAPIHVILVLGRLPAASFIKPGRLVDLSAPPEHGPEVAP